MDKAIWYDWNGANLWIFKLINGINGGAYYDAAMKNITLLGDKKSLPYILSAIAAYALVSFIGKIIGKHGGVKHYFIMWAGVFMIIGAGLATSYTTVSFLKSHFAYQRPYAALPADEVHHIEFRGEDDANRGFPSGHVAIITTIVIALWPALGSGFRWFGSATIFAVAWSRIALGVHFPADVLTSIILCLIEINMVRYILYGLMRKLFGARV
jgi:signal peptidase II